MAIAKRATIREVTSVGQDSIKLVANYEGEGFEPGKFLIVDSGLVSAEGKAIKRAYSLFDVDRNTKQFTCMVKKLWGTPTADYLHQRQVGDTLTFSGPWGKFYEQESQDSIWLIATDTGVTACHGYKKSIKQEQLKKFFWFREAEDYFLEATDMASTLKAYVIPPVGQKERAEVCWAQLSAELKNDRPEKICMAGDGDVLLFLKDKFIEEGFTDEQLQMELFFNNPAKKST